MYDVAHPNESGERKPANAFADGLHQGCGVGPSSPAPLGARGCRFRRSVLRPDRPTLTGKLSSPTDHKPLWT
ncbi:hypothetical protein AB0436_04215 [Streptomyces sp. NPDC051322]|uniref:hypothetical protein n=1 Tax=Streptomyces sp. NPDC051322 TaxID=3154645 RepID=UPI00344CAD89